jgi:large subunit ribosomal protein L23
VAEREVLLEPVVTEKSNKMREKHAYVFRVDSRCNKHEVLGAIRATFGVHPLSCRVMTVKRKPKRVRFRPGLTASWKKAIITLPANEKIDIFEGA